MLRSCPSRSRPRILPKASGLPEDDPAVPGQHVLDHIIVTHRDAAGGEHHIGIPGLLQPGGQLGLVVAGDAQHLRDAPVALDQPGDTVGVAVVDLAFR